MRRVNFLSEIREGAGANIGVGMIGSSKACIRINVTITTTIIIIVGCEG